jgi:hypothetical protein
MRALGVFTLGSIAGTALSLVGILASIGPTWSLIPLLPKILTVESESGESKVWYDAVGGLSVVAFYVDSVPNGAWIAFHRNGQISEMGHYVAGVRDGRWLAFLNDGSMVHSAVFSRGSLVSGEWPDRHTN